MIRSQQIIPFAFFMDRFCSICGTFSYGSLPNRKWKKATKNSRQRAELTVDLNFYGPKTKDLG